MSSRDIKTRLAELHRELENAPELDADLRRLLQEVDGDIHALLASRQNVEPEEAAEPDQELDGMRDRLEALAADFAAQHPNSERFFRELINALGRMGI